MRFVADGMLGKLTRWLRLLGVDTEYSRTMTDRQLLMLAKKEKRTLLTRDLQLYQQAVARGFNAFYVEGQTQAEELAWLARRYGVDLTVNMTKSRCPKCNTRVRSISMEKAAESVYKKTLKHYAQFWRCPKCRQTYWQGAHWTKIRLVLSNANQSSKPARDHSYPRT